MMGAVSILNSVIVTMVLILVSLSMSCTDGGRVGNSMNYYYRVQLIRRESALSPLMKAQNLTKAERMRLSLERSKRRLERLQAQARARRRNNYYSPVTAEDSGYILQLGIGHPKPLIQHMILDTGSDLIWLQCKPCTLCYKQHDPFYDPHASSTYSNLSCTSKFCTGSVHNFCYYPHTCGYFYTYGDHTKTTGVMAREAFSLKRMAASSSGDWESLPRGLLFGCGHRQEDGPTITVPGLVGLGRGVLSLVSQLGKNINYKFSYCLGPADDDDDDDAGSTSSLILGDAHLPGNFQSTPFLGVNDPNYYPSYYYLDLNGISVGGTMIKYPASTFRSGGLIIDSGTAVTYLVDTAYKPFVAAVKSSIKARPVSDDPQVCYKRNLPISKLPQIAFHFAGNATFVVPPRNSAYLGDDKERQLLCLAYASAGAEGNVSIFGYAQQQNFNVIYDLAKNKLSFAPAVCNNI